eukprot:757721-Hanusia_phi.AAC.7
MGCKESKPSVDEAPKWSKFQDATGECFINEEEQAAHLHAWRDPRTRSRLETQPPEEFAETTYEKILENLENNAHLRTLKAAAHSLPAAPIQPETPESPQGNETSASSRLRELEQAQALKKKQELLALDPHVWKRYALESRYQQGEDLLVEAQREEFGERGSTRRLAELKHAVALLYDYRSNLDVTGQQQLLSYVSYKHANDALEVWNDVEELVKEDRDAFQTVRTLKSETMLLMGKSLCNFALDGDGDNMGHDLTARDAFEKAKGILEEVEKIRLGQDAALAETVMALGYLSYCQAGAASNAGSRCSLDLSDEEIESLYNSALKYYKEAHLLYVKCYGRVSQGLFIERKLNDVQAHNDSIRMICNIALVHKAKGLVFHRLDELEKVSNRSGRSLVESLVLL